MLTFAVLVAVMSQVQVPLELSLEAPEVEFCEPLSEPPPGQGEGPCSSHKQMVTL